MNVVPELRLRDRIEWAELAARRVIRRPSLYSVVIESGGPDNAEPVQCGFQQARRNWFGQALLDVCQVRVLDRPESAVVTSHGTFRGFQYRRMAEAKESPFPPKPLELSVLTVEPADARARMQEHVRAGAAASAVEPQHLGLCLTIYAGKLAWHGTVDVPEIGVHSVILCAAAGHILFHKFDPYHRS